MSLLRKMVPFVAASFLLLSVAAEEYTTSTSGVGSLRASAAKKGTPFYYPDVIRKRCRSSVNKHLASWMEQRVDNGYIYHDVSSCCSANFGLDVAACLHDVNKVGAAKPNYYRRLGGKSGKSNKSGKGKKSGKQGTSWNPPAKNPGPSSYHQQKPIRPPWQSPSQQSKPTMPHNLYLDSGKSSKGSKSSKRSKSSKGKKNYYYPATTPSKPQTRKPTLEPTPKPVTAPADDKMIEITLGGLLKTRNLSVPPSGSLPILAEVFEKTILAVLDDGFECDVYNINGISISDTNMDSFSDAGVRGGGAGIFNRNLQASSSSSNDVLFNLRVIEPCPGDCSSTQAVIQASRVYDETFEELDEKAKSGELAVIFCIFAEDAGLVTDQCEVTFTSVGGTSLDVNDAFEGVGTTKPTDKPSPMPIMPKDSTTPIPTPKQTPMPVVVTTEPSPKMETIQPSSKPTVGDKTTDPSSDASSTLPPVTSRPTSIPQSTGPSMAPTTLDHVAPEQPPVTIPPIAPTEGTSNPTQSITTTAPVNQPVTMPPIALTEETSSPTQSVTTTAPVNQPVTMSPIALTEETSSPTQKATTTAPVNQPVTMPPNMIERTSNPTSSATTIMPVEAPSTTMPPPSANPTAKNMTASPSLEQLPFQPTPKPSLQPSQGAPTSSTPAPKLSNGPTLLSSSTDSTGGPTPFGATSQPTKSLSPTGNNSTLPPVTDTETIHPSSQPSSQASLLATTNATSPPVNDTESSQPSLQPSSLATTNATYPSVDNTESSQPSSQASVPATANATTNVTSLPGNDTESSQLDTLAPTGPPTTSPVTPSSSTTTPTEGGSAPSTPGLQPSAPTTASPTPSGALYFDGFEEAAFPEFDPEWSTQGDGLWKLTTERAKTGTHSIRTPDLSGSVDLTPGFSNVTLSTNPDWPAGTIVLSILAGVTMPHDGLFIYVDEITRGQPSDKTDFEQLRIEVGPGPHQITFAYAFNPVDLDELPPIDLAYIGGVFIDDVYFLPAGLTIAPTGAGIVEQTSPPAPGVQPSPPSTPSPTPPGALYFDGFEEAAFPEFDPEWSTQGDGEWTLSSEQVKSGDYSIKSPDLSNDDQVSQSSNVTITTNPDWPAGTLVVHIYAGVLLPYDNLSYYVDGQPRAQVSASSDFERLLIPFGPGSHEVTFTYNYNPFALDALPPDQPDHVGAVYIDDVYFVPEGVTLSPTGSPVAGIAMP